MNKDQVKGSLKKAKGSVEAAVGKAIGSDRMRVEGATDKAVGSAQKA
jgi:uncharacterized protein YjbJ (UPF0337 family)